MGTTSEKLTYLNNTKQLLKDKINNLGGSIDDNTTFRQYANQLQNVYDNLPKTEYQEGTEINLGVTIKGKLDYENGVVGIGQTEQDSTKGYQLAKPIIFNKTGYGITWSMNGNIITASGTANANTQSIAAGEITNDMLTVLPTGTYIVSGGTSNTKIQVIKYDNGSVSQLALDSGNNATFTLTETTNVVCRGSISNGTALTGTETIKVMLESGSTAHNWEQYTGGIPSPNPSYNEDINSVTGNQDVVVSGKNLFDIGTSLDDWFQTSTNGTKIGNTSVNVATATISNNKLTIDTYNTSGWNWISKWVTLKKNTDYIISGTNDTGIKIVGFSSNELQSTGTELASKSASETTKTFNSGDYDYYCLSMYPGGTGKYIENIQIEANSSATPYEPYKTPKTYQFSLGDHKFYGIGTYRDYILRTTGKNKFGGTLYNGQVGSNGGYSSSTNRITNISGENDVGTTKLSKGTYTISVAGLDYCTLLTKNSNGTILDNFANEWQALPFTFTLTQEGYVSFTARKSDNSNINTSYNVMLEQGSTATDYQPYGVGNWYKVGKIGETIYTGSSSEIWAKANVSSGNNVYSIGNNLYLREEMIICYCNYFQAVINGIAGNLQNNQCRFRYYNDTGKNFYVCNNAIDNVNDFKTWLSTHNLEVCYILDTPTYTPITGTLAEQLEAWWNGQSIDGTTIIEGNGDLPMIIKVRGLKGE